MHEVTCPVCHSSRHYERYQIAKWNPPLKIRKCADCGSLFQFPLPADPDSFYHKDYYSGKAEYSYLDERQHEKFAAIVHRARLRTIRQFVPGGKFLDIGCSFGGFVRSALNYFDAYGVDVSDYAVSEGNTCFEQPRLFSVRDAVYCNPPLEKNTFSVITMVEVAEHLQEPSKTFRQCFEWLAPGGLLLIQTANFEGWQARKAGKDYHYFLPGHLTYFSANGLKQLLRNVGFSRFREYIPVDFGVLPKLRKSRGSFDSFTDYRQWGSIAKYHWISKVRFRGAPLTSSYVLYAFKE